MVRRVARFAHPYRFMLLGFVLVILAGSVMTLIPPLLFRHIIDDIIPDQNSGRLNFVVLLIVVAALVEATAKYWERRWSAKIGEGLIFDLRVALFDHVQRLPILFFTRTQTGALVSRMNNDVIGAQRALTSTLGQVAANVVVLAVTLGAMFVLEWRLTLLALLILPIFIIPTKRVGSRVQGILRNQMDDNAAMVATMSERMNVSGAMLVKLFGRYPREKSQLAKQAGRVRDNGIKSALVAETFFISLTLMGALGTALIYWLGGHLVIDGSLTIGTLAAMGLFVVRIYTPLTALTNARVDLMAAFVSFERVFEVLDLPNDLPDSPDAKDLEEPRGEVRFEDVWFTYPTATDDFASLTPIQNKKAPFVGADAGKSNVAGSDAGKSKTTTPSIAGVSFTAQPGQHVAIVGPSGAGKTTLISLVPRLHDASSGSVSIDSNNVRDLTAQSLRTAIGVVSQDPHLFHDTIRANLLYVRPEASQAEIEEACRAAQIHSLIESLPEGYDTLVGERGYRLSGGEKQRLAIARVILKNPAIIILDEATSHLDTENEATIQKAFDTILHNRTALIVAHRLSTIISADKILVLDRGRIVEEGNHEQLLADNGLYADLYKTLEEEELLQ